MHDIAPAPASRHGRTLPIARLAALALVLALSACKGKGDGKDGDAKDDANKPPEAVAVEVAFAPAACRAPPVRGLVVISLTDRPGGPRVALGRDRWRVFKCEERIRVVNFGGTAIGTGLTAPIPPVFKPVSPSPILL